jgi:hypothetical protein
MKTPNTLTARAAFAALALSCLPAGAAPDYRLEASAITGGGGTSAAGPYTLSGTIGQTAAGRSAGGPYAVVGGFWSAALEVIPPEPDESFAAWMAGLGEGDLPPDGQRGPLDAPAGDGMSNLLKYALGLSPMVPAAEAAPRLVLVTVAEPEGPRSLLAIELQRSTRAAVGYALEASTHLSGWTAAPFVLEVVDPAAAPDRELVRLITAIAVEEGQRHFLRLRVTLP